MGSIPTLSTIQVQTLASLIFLLTTVGVPAVSKRSWGNLAIRETRYGTTWGKRTEEAGVAYWNGEPYNSAEAIVKSLSKYA